jgi:photosystem II stability/assembly factor-like uncharacterized protein
MALFLRNFVAMRYSLIFLFAILVLSCSETQIRAPFQSVEIKPLFQDSVSVRAIELMGNTLAFAGSNGVFGSIDLGTGKVRINVQQHDSLVPEFRAVVHTATDFFMLSVANPALLFKTGEDGKMDLVYKEEGEGVFYDAMTFWNNREGIAIGDSRNGCLSVIITRDGGHHWSKIACNELPEGIEGEGAFAASNSNIAVNGDMAWIATTKRLLITDDKGKTWNSIKSPLLSEEPTQGIYSIDFYNDKIGVAIGGDYTKPALNTRNKAITNDGGKTWQLMSDGTLPGYKSCIRFVPNSNGKEIVAVGFTGITYSSDQGKTWKNISEESFYTIRFKNDSIAYAAGKNRIARLNFK